MGDIEVNPQLKPQSIEKKKETPVAFQMSQETLFAGFFGRLGAFALDFAVLYMFASMLNTALRDPLLGLGGTSRILSIFVMLAYFTLSFGPLGKGRTLGKYLMQIRVVDANGKFLEYPKAFFRALVMTAPVLVVVFSRFLDSEADSNSDYLIIIFYFISFFIISYFLCNVLCVMTDPLKRSFQDFICRSHVTRISYVSEDLGAEIAQKRASAPKWSIVQWAIVAAPAVIFATMSVKSFSTNDQEANEEYKKINEEFISIVDMEGFALKKILRGEKIESADPSSQELILRLKVEVIGDKKISDEQIRAFERTKSRADELRGWFIKHVDERTKAAIKKNGLYKAQAIRMSVDLIETLDLGFVFKGAPIDSFQSDFDRDEMRSFGVYDEETSATLSSKL